MSVSMAPARSIYWSDIVDEIAPAGWPATLGRTASATLADVARRLPVAGTAAIIAECRLDEVPARVDVSVRLTQDAAAWIAAHDGSGLLAPAHPARSVVRQLLDEFRPDGIARVARRECWLEFDSDSNDALSPPSCFVAIRRDRSVSGDAVAELLRIVAPHVAAPVRHEVARVVDALPLRASLAQLGLMLGRSPDAPIRLCVRGASADELDAIWARVGRGGPSPAPALREWSGGDDAARADYVDFDVLEGLGSRVGLEFRCDRRSQARGALRERAWLLRLRAAGFIAAEWIDALCEWPGARRVTLPHQLWPSLTARVVNHCKLIVADGAVTAVKAYCMLLHQDAPPRPTTSPFTLRST